MTDHRIIRTVEELEALDPDTVIEKPGTMLRTVYEAITVTAYWGLDAVLPAVVIREGAEVRAAREALEKETTND